MKRLRRDPGFAAAAANLVETALQAGEIGARARAADRFIAIAPASLRARYSRGLVALQQNDLATARADFAALTAASPSYALAHYNLAVHEMRAATTRRPKRNCRVRSRSAPATPARDSHLPH